MGKHIRNVSFLDLTSALPEVLADISTIRNVSFLLYTDKQAPLIAHVTMQNISNTVHVPDHFKLINGGLEVDKNYLSCLKEPLFLLINGQLIVEDGVSQEDVESGISGLHINGDIICPERLKGIIREKIQVHNGKLFSYLDNVLLINSDLHIDEAYLQSIDRSTRLVITGNAWLTSVFDEKLLAEKLESLEVWGKAVFREECMEIMNRKLVNREKCSLTIIPRGSVYMDKELHIDSISIKKYNQAKLYATNKLWIDDDVTEELLRQHILRINAVEMVIARNELRPALLEILDQANVTFLTYTDRLLVIEGEHWLTSTELKYTSGKISMIVNGALDIDSSISADTLYEKIEYIYNFGEIITNGEQYGVIQVKLRTNNGCVTQRDESKSEEHEMKEVVEKIEQVQENGNAMDGVVIANVIYLRL
jgi:hypothetical protein